MSSLDITFCYGKDCKKKKKCFRYVNHHKKALIGTQFSISDFLKNNRCDAYMDLRRERNLDKAAEYNRKKWGNK